MTKNECRNYLYFAFKAVYFDVDAVINGLKLEPTSLMIKKEPVPKSTSWMYRIDAGNDFDLEIYLTKLIDIFETRVDEINKLKERLNLTTLLQLVIEIDINPVGSTPYFGLNMRTVDFLSRTGTEVDFDLYKVDTMGLYDKLDEE